MQTDKPRTRRVRKARYRILSHIPWMMKGDCEWRKPSKTPQWPVTVLGNCINFEASVTPDERNQTYSPPSPSLPLPPTLVTRNNCQTRRKSFEKEACQASPRGLTYATVRWESTELADRGKRDEVSGCTTRSHNSLITMAMGKRKQTIGSVCEKKERRKQDTVGRRHRRLTFMLCDQGECRED